MITIDEAALRRNGEALRGDMQGRNSVVQLTVQIGGVDGPVKRLSGRFAWALATLIEAGERGATPIERPAPRWSHYVHILRREGFAIETIEERHGGPYRGWHGRYVLRSSVAVVEEAPR
jgi:hypothetical protein